MVFAVIWHFKKDFVNDVVFFNAILILPQSTPQMQAASHTRRKVLTLVCNLSADTSLQTYCYVNMLKLIGSVSCTLTAARKTNLRCICRCRRLVLSAFRRLEKLAHVE